MDVTEHAAPAQENGMDLHLPHYANAILCSSNAHMHTVTNR